MYNTLLNLSVLSALGLITTTAALADDIETIEVTADFRGKTQADIASSVSVITDTIIDNRAAQHLEEIINVAPNLNFSSGAGRGRFIQIRGIGERSQFSEPVNPSVGFIIDDMDFSGVAGIGTLFDVEQVEVLRGPQGTAFGASAMAGAVKLKTVDPSATANGQFRASLAQQNTWELAGAYGDAINDQWQYRVAVQQFKSDGFIENIHLNRDDTDNLDEFTSRVKLRYLPSTDLTVDFSWQYFDIDNGYDAFSLDNDRKTRSDEPGFDRQQTHAFGINANWQQDWGQIQAIVTHNTSDLEYGYDEDWTFVGFHPFEYQSTDYYFRDRDNSSIDVRFSGNSNNKLFSGSTLWVVGAFYRQIDEDLLRQYTFADGDFSSEYALDSFALYGELETQLADHWQLISGVRLENTEVDYTDSNQFTDNADDTLVGGKLVLEYQTDASGLWYAGIYRGYKLGGFNPDQRITNERRLFDPEYNWNYEVGTKQYFLENRLYVAAALFYMDRTDTQISDFTTIAIDDTGATSFVDVIANADVGKNYGLELQTRYELSEGVSLFANLGLLNATFESYVNAKGEFVAEQDQAQAPDYTFNAGVEWHPADNLRINIEADGKDEFRFSDGHDELSEAFVLWNARATYQLNDWQLSLWAKNLFDETYYVRGFGGFSNDPRDEYAFPEPYFQIGDGRQVGVTAQFIY